MVEISVYFSHVNTVNNFHFCSVLQLDDQNHVWL